MVILHESRVRRRCREAGPAGERFGVKQHAAQFAIGFDEGADRLGNAPEIGRFEGLLRANDQDSLVAQ
jgi:hypothetical protein